MRMSNLILSAVLTVTVTVVTASGTTLYLDAAAGNDTTGTGSAGSPWQTVEKARTSATGGDTVVLAAGSYDVYYDRGSGSLTDWVTWISAPGETATIERVEFGHWQTLSDKYLRFINIEFASNCVMYNAMQVEYRGCMFRNEVLLQGCRYVLIDSCYPTMPPPLNGSKALLERVSFEINGGRRITIQNCEITATCTGISAGGDSIVIRNNHIHDNSHDGIRVTGMRHGLIENNHIHHLDDGKYDSSATNIAEYGADACATWSLHVDAIHIFIKGSACSTVVPNCDLTVRGNIIHDIEDQGIQINNYLGCPSIHNHKLLFENNIFGPTHANNINMADPVDTVVFRHNTQVYFPEGRDFVSLFRTIHMNNYTVRISANYTQVYCYNNLLVDVGVMYYAPDRGMTNRPELMDFNLYRFNTQNNVVARNSIVDSSEHLAAPGTFDGVLLASSPAVNNGTSRYADSIFAVLPTDFYGTARDIRPDMGVYELAGQDPEPEPEPVIDTTRKTVFIDDFKDSEFMLDPWLDTVGVQGLSWTQGPGNAGNYVVAMRGDQTCAAGPSTTGPAWLFSDQGGNWQAYTLDFSVINTNMSNGDGPLLLAQHDSTYYWLELGKEQSRIRRVLNGADSLLGESAAIAIPGTERAYMRVSVDAGSTGVTINVDDDADGTVDFTVTDTDPAAITAFLPGGGIGFHKEFPVQYNRMYYSDIRVEVSRFTPQPVSAVNDMLTHTGRPAAALLAHPVTNTLLLDLSGFNGRVRAALYDNTGQQVRGLVVSGSTAAVDIHGLPDGVYYYVLAGNGRTESGRCMVVH